MSTQRAPQPAISIERSQNSLNPLLVPLEKVGHLINRNTLVSKQQKVSCILGHAEQSEGAFEVG